MRERKPGEKHYSAGASMLAFYSGYNSNKSPSIRNVKVELGKVDGVPTYEDSPITLQYTED